MEVKLLKDWASYKKGDQIQITDKDVLEKGFEIGLFEKEKSKKEVEPKEK